MKSGTVDKHRGSILLKPEENEQVFQLIGNRCQCLAAGVIQLYLTEPPIHKEWIKKTTGIITLIRDNPRRSFFLRLYCLQRRAMIWEHEVYNAMGYKAPLSYFHTFEAEEYMAAFNFASETDALTLRNILLDKLNAKRHKRQQRRSKMEIEGQHGGTLLWRNQSSPSPVAFSTGSTSNLANGTPTTIGVNRSASSSSMYKPKKKKRDKTKRRLTKDDIGPPSNFRHLTHLQFSSNNKIVDPVDPHLKMFLDKVGVSEDQFSNQETRKFIYDFIEQNGGMSAIREDVSTPNVHQLQQQQQQQHQHQQPPPLVAPHRQEFPPPVPARIVSHQTKSAPSLPPSRIHAPSTPPSAPSNAPPVHRVPVRPPPPSITTAPSLPPPPPPPPPAPVPPSRTNSSAPVPPPPPPLPNLVNTEEETVNTSATNNKNNNNNTNSNNNNEENADPRSMLMESIRSGTTLRKVEKTESKPPPPPPDTRNALLEQIRQGVELRPVANEVKSQKNPPMIQGSGLASALSRALAERSSAIHSESDDSTSETSDEDEWDD